MRKKNNSKTSDATLLPSQLQNKYFTSATTAIRNILAQRGQLIGRLFLYCMIVYLFYQVFKSVNAEPKRVWYLAITEWLILSVSYISFQIAEDIKTGQIAYFLLRPMNYITFRFWEFLGGTSLRFILLGIICLSLGFSLTHTLPFTLPIWIFGIVISILSILLNTLMGILIGLLSFWIKEIHPLVYLNLTATFCFGGLIVPLEFYSDTMKIIAFSTPYPWILWWPAQSFLNPSATILYGLIPYFIWMIFLSIIIWWVYTKCLKSFVAEGG